MPMTDDEYEAVLITAEAWRDKAVTAEADLLAAREQLAAIEALREKLSAIRTFSSGEHKGMGEACGEDLCLGCLIHGTAEQALAAVPDSTNTQAGGEPPRT